MSEEKPPTVDAKSSTISTATYLKFPESTSLRFAPLVFGAYGIVRNLCNNKIGGNIPLSLPPNLEELLLSGNEIYGLIPPSIASLSQIVAITLDHNKLIGIIPEAFHRLPRLARIFLQYNSLEGSLAVLEDLPLTYLNIMHNNFHPIPKKFFDIPNFKCSPEEIYHCN